MEKNKKLALVMIYRRPPAEFLDSLRANLLKSGADQCVLVHTGRKEELEPTFAVGLQRLITEFSKHVEFILFDYQCPKEFETDDGKRYIGDFAAARNFAHGLATADWHLTLDADDELVTYRLLRTWLDTLPQGVRAVSAVYDYLGKGETSDIKHRRIRLIRALPGDVWRWTGELHEALEGDSQFLFHTLSVSEDVFSVTHHGNLEESSKRNAALVRSVDCRTPSMKLARASVEALEGNYFAGLRLAREVFEETRQTSVGYLAAMNAASCARNLGDFDGASDFLGRAITAHPGRREARCLLARLRYDSGDVQGAAKEYRDAFFVAKGTNEGQWGMEFRAMVHEGRRHAVKVFCELEDFDTAEALGGHVEDLRKISEASDALAVYVSAPGCRVYSYDIPDAVKELLSRAPEGSLRAFARRKLTGIRRPTIIPTRDADHYLAGVVYGTVGYFCDDLTDLPNMIPETDSEGQPITLIMNPTFDQTQECDLIICDRRTLIIGHYPPILYEIWGPDDKLEYLPLTGAQEQINFSDGWKVVLCDRSRKHDIVLLDILAPGPLTWGPHSIEYGGIGGSEQAVIHLAPIIAKEWDVTVWAHKLDAPTIHRGVRWRPADAFYPEEHLGSHTLVWRSAEALPAVAKLKENKSKKCKIIFWAHDVPKERDKDHYQYADKILVLSKYHKELYLDLGIPEEKLVLTQNGIDVQAVERAYRANETRPRDPHSCFYASSGVRGLLWLLDMWPNVRARVSDARLHVATDLSMLTKLRAPTYARQLARDLLERMDALRSFGVEYMGALPHQELLELEGRCSVWAYPTPFYEISCITAMEAQAMGCLPVVSDTGALKETVFEGALMIRREALLARVSPFGKLQLDATGELWTPEPYSPVYLDTLITALQYPLNDGMRRKLSERAIATYDWKQAAVQFKAAFTEE